MTLISTIQLAKNALFTSQLGIQVAANNISNADTPGYVRESLILSPAPTQSLGRIVMGTGVQALGVVREVNTFVQERLRAANSDLVNGETQEKVYAELEASIGELSDADLSTALTDFFGSLHDVLNQPEDPAIRNLAIQRGVGLSNRFHNLDGRVRDLRALTNDRVIAATSEVNQLVGLVAKLNIQIIATEQGGAIVSDAVGLRDKRDQALEDLSKLVNIRVDEQKTGAVNVFVGGDYLVFDGATQEVNAVPGADRRLASVELRLSRSDSALDVTSGELKGLLTARDDILGGFIDDLDGFAQTLMFEFNKVHSSGQGVTGFQDVTGTYGAVDVTAPIDEAGLDFTPEHGSFQVLLTNENTGVRTTHDVWVQLNGLEDDTTLTSLAADLSAIDGIGASLTVDGKLQITADDGDLAFAFANDTSGSLAALGINTFFTGNAASNIGVNDRLLADPGKIAVSRDGIGNDTRNGERLADLLGTPLDSRDGATLSQVYEQWTSQTAQASALSKAMAEGFRSFQTTLEGEHLGFSGVNLDEEAVNMLTFQRSFQASAKVISTVSELMDVLVNL